MSNDMERRLVDSVALQAYLAQHLPAVDKDTALQIERIRGGHSNETFFITSGSEQFVLRRPPYGPLLPTAHDVGREYRILKALTDTSVPVPSPLLYCEDIQVIGAPFYLMERIPGLAIRDTLPSAFEQDIQARTGIGEALIDALVELHKVDWQQAGLEGFGKPQGYLARQLRRWTGQLEASRSRPIPDLDAVTVWLQEHLPESQVSTIVHGDYRLDNALLAPEPPARVLAIVDWEMSTLGDPLADLGYLLSFWREADDPPFSLDASWQITGLPGFSSRADLVQRYIERTGRKVEHLDFYIALAIWKLAVLLEGSYKRYLAGTTDDPFFPVLEKGVPALAKRALSVCHGEMKFLP
ncbi:acyl-CoA dehydrogenase [Dictyobacter vulcani]|uniref:Acyl-CoA dehydrogenase n=1 Tax=Dictyobacter vulcani TaxID=2607529 RepID=A0A5J4KW17_9CHLR|nr:phosphotransferase family protein [Dictyobacter vulcani]GER90319.1 acyl-CoA dehydrogenase [Dictyobacter vulcani]